MEIIYQFLHSLAAGTIPPLGYWSYIVLAILVAFEGPSVTILGAMMASTGVLQPGLVLVAAMLGNLSADVGWYLLGFLGRFEGATHRVSWLRQHQTRIAQLERDMDRHAVKILLLAKLTLSMSIFALIAAGVARVPWRRWLPVVIFGECIWTGGLVIAGFYLGGYLWQLEIGLRIAAIVGVVAFVGLIIWFFKRDDKSSPPRML